MTHRVSPVRLRRRETRRSKPFTALLFATLLFASPALAQRRFALIVGENQGNAGDATLRFAEDDAQRMRDVLVEVGQVAPGDATLLLGATASTLRHALEGLGATLRDAAQPGNRLTLYVSSHAGDGALHLAGSELPLGELVDFVKQAPVDVGVLIIDACRAGSMTRVKGLVASGTPPVLIEATGLQGRVLISASGADEYAQGRSLRAGPIRDPRTRQGGERRDLVGRSVRVLECRRPGFHSRTGRLASNPGERVEGPVPDPAAPSLGSPERVNVR